MPGLIYNDELKKAMCLPENARQSTLEKALRKRKIAFGYGENGLFSTLDAVNMAIMGETSGQDDEPIKLLD